MCLNGALVRHNYRKISINMDILNLRRCSVSNTTMRKLFTVNSFRRLEAADSNCTPKSCLIFVSWLLFFFFNRAMIWNSVLIKLNVNILYEAYAFLKLLTKVSSSIWKLYIANICKLVYGWNSPSSNCFQLRRFRKKYTNSYFTFNPCIYRKKEEKRKCLL